MAICTCLYVNVGVSFVPLSIVCATECVMIFPLSGGPPMLLRGDRPWTLLRADDVRGPRICFVFSTIHTLNCLGLCAATQANANDPRDVRCAHATSVTRRITHGSGGGSTGGGSDGGSGGGGSGGGGPTGGVSAGGSDDLVGGGSNLDGRRLDRRTLDGRQLERRLGRRLGGDATGGISTPSSL